MVEGVSACRRVGVWACGRVGVWACRRVGPKGLRSLAQALAWVVLFLGASPVRAPEKAGAIHIDRTQIQMTISSAPSGLIAFNCDATQAKVWAKSQGPSGRNRLQSPTGSQALAWVARYNALGLKDREKPQTLRLPHGSENRLPAFSGSR
jgi:hypothetical protein